MRLQRRDEMVADHLLLKSSEPLSDAIQDRLHQDLGVRVVGQLATGSVWHLQFALRDSACLPRYVDALSQWEFVSYAEPDHLVWMFGNVPNDPAFANGDQWPLHNTGQNSGTSGADISALDAWKISTGSPEVVVGIIDTGIDYKHSDLDDGSSSRGNLWVNPSPSKGDVIGWDYVNNDGDPMDVHGHGTQIAGIIGAIGNNDQGITGVNWRVSMATLRISDGSGSVSGIIDSFYYAIQNNFNVLNLSWGVGNSSTLRNAIIDAGNAGILCVAAAGNSGEDIDDKPTYPASWSLDNLITVAATDRNDAMPSWSNYGAEKVHLGAPGASVYTTDLTGSGGSDRYVWVSGTSFSAPHVVGAAAMLYAVRPDITPLQAKTILMESGDPVSSLEGKTVSGRRLNLAAAVQAALPEGRRSIAMRRLVGVRWIRDLGGEDEDEGEDNGDYQHFAPLDETQPQTLSLVPDAEELSVSQ